MDVVLSFCKEMVEGKGEAFIKNEPSDMPAKVFFLEDDPANVYCYPAVFAGEDYLLCAYYHSYDTPRMLSATVIKKVMLSEIEE